MQLKDKFIGFVDILGYKEMLKSAEAGTGMAFPQLLKLAKQLGSQEDKLAYSEYGPPIGSDIPPLQHDLDFQLTQFADSVLVSSEISPAGIINLMNYCTIAVLRLLREGRMCRGSITRGEIHHIGTDYSGPGFQKACTLERQVTAFKRDADERGTPFVEIDPAVCLYVMTCDDKRVKEMFSRFVKEDGEVTALFPFTRLTRPFADSIVDPVKGKQDIKTIRQWIVTVKEGVGEFVDKSNLSAVKKGEQYIRALDEQLEFCNRTDEMLDYLSSPFPAHDLGSLNG